MENEKPNNDKEEKSFIEEDGKRKADTKKGISVTRALVMMGFDDWKDLEPRNYTDYNL